ncbi:recombinase family protein, partial [Brevibacterium paucivorans]
RVKDRPQWLACLDYLRPGDTLMVRRLDRIAGSETMAIQTINELHERGVNIKSLTEPDIDTTTPMGRALFGIVAVFAQLRVDTIRDIAKVLGVGASSVSRALAKVDDEAEATVSP